MCGELTDLGDVFLDLEGKLLDGAVEVVDLAVQLVDEGLGVLHVPAVLAQLVPHVFSRIF